MFLEDLEEDKTPSEGDECSNCDGVLVERSQRVFGTQPFLGCSNYPKCEFTIDI